MTDWATAIILDEVVNVKPWFVFLEDENGLIIREPATVGEVTAQFLPEHVKLLKDVKDYVKARAVKQKFMVRTRTSRQNYIRFDCDRSEYMTKKKGEDQDGGCCDSDSESDDGSATLEPHVKRRKTQTKANTKCPYYITFSRMKCGEHIGRWKYTWSYDIHRGHPPFDFAPVQLTSEQIQYIKTQHERYALTSQQIRKVMETEHSIKLTTQEVYKSHSFTTNSFNLVVYLLSTKLRTRICRSSTRVCEPAQEVLLVPNPTSSKSSKTVASLTTWFVCFVSRFFLSESKEKTAHLNLWTLFVYQESLK
jgi:hypothetical protein